MPSAVGSAATPIDVEDIKTLSCAEWDEAVSATGLPFRFSHRAAAGKAFEAAYPSYRFEPRRAEFADGAVALFPLVRVKRRLNLLSMVLGMPLGWEGSPLPKYQPGSQLQYFAPGFSQAGNGSSTQTDGLAHSGAPGAFHLPNPDGVDPNSLAFRSFDGLSGVIWISAVTIIDHGFEPIGDGAEPANDFETPRFWN